MRSTRWTAMAEDSHVHAFHATVIDGRTGLAAHISDRCHFRLVHVSHRASWARKCYGVGRSQCGAAFIICYVLHKTVLDLIDS
jgi:hypothetical protein